MRAHLLAALVLAACTMPDTLRPDEPRAATAFAVAPYEFHEECATLQKGERIDYRFESQAPVNFQIYYREGITYISTISRDEVLEASGVFNVPEVRRYCVRWDAGRQGALLDFRIRILRAAKL